MSAAGKLKERLLQARAALEAQAFDQAFGLCNVPPRPSGATDLSLLTAPAPGVPATLEADRLMYGAYALFGLGHVHQAADWVGDYGRVRPDAVFYYFQALLSLHAREPDQALLAWTRIVQEYPSETLADRLIEKLRKGEAGLLRDIAVEGALREFLPPIGPKPPVSFPRSAAGPVDENAGADHPSRRAPLAVLAIVRSFFRRFGLYFAIGLVLAAGSGFAWAAFAPELRDLWGRPDPYRHLEQTLPGPPEGGSVATVDPAEAGSIPVVYPNRDAVAADLRRARALIVEGRVNQARRLLAGIAFSNASFELKERARLLRDMIPAVAREDFRDPIVRQQAAAEPLLYAGAEVLWQGRVARELKRVRPGFVLEREEQSPAVAVELPAEGALGRTPRVGERWEVYGSFAGMDARGILSVRARQVRPVAQTKAIKQVPSGDRDKSQR